MTAGSPVDETYRRGQTTPMTVRDGLGVIRERWLVVLSAVVLGLVAATATWLLTPTRYTAPIAFYVSAQTADNTQTAYQGGLLSQERVTSYVELLESTRLSQEVIRTLNLTETPEQLVREIVASNETDSVIIHVAVTDRSAPRAAAIANAVGTSFTKLVAELERPTDPFATPPVAVHVILPAPVPLAPSSPGLAVVVALGLLAGLVLGVGAALARNLLDVSIKTAEQLRRVTGAPNLASIGFDASVRTHPLTVQEGPTSLRAEAFRQLRTNLRFLDVDNGHGVIVLTSPLPDEGKTTTVLNLALAMVASNQRILVIDADLRRPSVARMLGIEGGVGLTTVLSDWATLQDAIQPWAAGLDVLASGALPPNPSELLGSHHMARVLEQVRARYDCVLIDTPPLLPVTDAAALAPLTDGALVMARCRRTTSDQVRQAVDAIAAVGVPVLGTVLTMVPPHGPQAYAHYKTRLAPTGRSGEPDYRPDPGPAQVERYPDDTGGPPFTGWFRPVPAAPRGQPGRNGAVPQPGGMAPRHSKVLSGEWS